MINFEKCSNFLHLSLHVKQMSLNKRVKSLSAKSELPVGMQALILRLTNNKSSHWHSPQLIVNWLVFGKCTRKLNCYGRAIIINDNIMDNIFYVVCNHFFSQHKKARICCECPFANKGQMACSPKWLCGFATEVENILPTCLLAWKTLYPAPQRHNLPITCCRSMLW